MKKSMIINEEVLFKANAEQVWDLITNPEMTKQYMFGCAIISDWKLGSAVSWIGKTEDGKEIIYVRGKVLEYDYGKKVTSTTFDPHSGMADTPENHINLTYEVSDVDGGTLLKIIQGDFSGAEEGEKRYQESMTGWKEVVIPLMKNCFTNKEKISINL